MPVVVYTRARARVRAPLIYIEATTTTTTTIYTYTYTLHLLGFWRVILVRTRDTPRHAKSQKNCVTIDPEITVIFVTFAHPLAALSQFHHRIYCP